MRLWDTTHPYKVDGPNTKFIHPDAVIGSFSELKEILQDDAFAEELN